MGSSTSRSSQAGALVTRRFPFKDKSRHEFSPGTNVSTIEGNDIGGDFSRRLRDMGIAKAKPTYSLSATVQRQYENNVSAQNSPCLSQNTTVAVLQARETLQQLANDDASRYGSSAKRFADMRVAIDAIRMRDSGLEDEAIEKLLHLQPGSVNRVGSSRIICHIAEKSCRSTDGLEDCQTELK
ncbi:hypothetical protein E4U54_000263 [Claviceps lovelessii]|nr:hypothetical protein E4U54_000263 [Claviceps lovelessii]